MTTKKKAGGPSAPNVTREVAALHDAARRAREHAVAAHAYELEVLAQIDFEQGPRLVTEEQDLRRTVAKIAAIEAEHAALRAEFAAGLSESKAFARRIADALTSEVERAESIPRRDATAYESALHSIDLVLRVNRLDFEELAALRAREGIRLHSLPAFPAPHAAREFVEALRAFADSTPTLSIDEMWLRILRDKEETIRANIETARIAQAREDEINGAADWQQRARELVAEERYLAAREEQEVAA